jgi:hypothetical protein
MLETGPSAGMRGRGIIATIDHENMIPSGRACDPSSVSVDVGSEELT